MLFKGSPNLKCLFAGLHVMLKKKKRIIAAILRSWLALVPMVFKPCNQKKQILHELGHKLHQQLLFYLSRMASAWFWGKTLGRLRKLNPTITLGLENVQAVLLLWKCIPQYQCMDRNRCFLSTWAGRQSAGPELQCALSFLPILLIYWRFCTFACFAKLQIPPGQYNLFKMLHGCCCICTLSRAQCTCTL